MEIASIRTCLQFLFFKYFFFFNVNNLIKKIKKHQTKKLGIILFHLYLSRSKQSKLVPQESAFASYPKRREREGLPGAQVST